MGFLDNLRQSMEYANNIQLPGVPPYSNPMDFGMDMPQQGGITGNQYPSQDMGLPPPPMMPPNIPVPLSIMGLGPDFNISSMEPPPFDEGSFIRRRMQELYTPENAAQERYNQLLSRYPTRNKPSFMQKLAGSMIAGAKGPEAADKVMYKDYYNNLEDWKNQIGPTMNSANLERYSNQNERMLANQQVTQEINWKKAEEAERKNRATERQKAFDSETRRKRAEAYIDYTNFKRTHPNWKILPSKGGTVKLYNPTNPSEIWDTKVDAGTMTEFNRLEKINEGALDRAAIGAESRENIAGARGTIVQDPDGQTYWVSQDGQTVRPVNLPKGVKKVGTDRSGSSSDPNAREIHGRRLNRANEILDREPGASKYFTVEGSNIIFNEEAYANASPAERKLIQSYRDRIYQESDITTADKANTMRIKWKRTGVTGRIPRDKFNPREMEEVPDNDISSTPSRGSFMRGPQ